MKTALTHLCPEQVLANTSTAFSFLKTRGFIAKLPPRAFICAEFVTACPQQPAATRLGFVSDQFAGWVKLLSFGSHTAAPCPIHPREVAA